MSFSFKWPRFSDQFHETAIQLLNNALNKGNKPPVIADKIEVVELEMGTQPPELEIRDIGDLTMTQFRGIFRMSYAGDAHIVLSTKVQANPLYHKKTGLHQMGGSKGMLAANQPLVVPMLLRLSNFRLNSVVVLVVSKPKGITLVFKTDPLQNVDIHSTFDSIAVIQNFIQKEIEEQLRQMFREDLPGIIHKLSQQWVKKSTTVETPYLLHQPSLHRPEIDTASNPELIRGQTDHGYNRTCVSKSEIHSPSLAPGHSDREYSSTLGRPSISNLRFNSAETTYLSDTFRRLAHLRGVGGMSGLEEPGERELDNEFGSGSFDVVDPDDAVLSTHPSVGGHSVVEYESIPAVGGGMVTRPRILHSASILHQSLPTSSPVPSSSRLTAPALEELSRSLGEDSVPRSFAKHEFWESTVLSEHLVHSRVSVSDAETLLDQQQRTFTVAMGHGGSRYAAIPVRSQRLTGRLAVSDNVPPPSPTQGGTFRRSSFSSQPTYDLSFDSDSDPTDPKITLRPSSHSAISQLSLLNRSHNTLSPLPGNLEHIATRSMPASMLSATNGSSTEKLPVKARRKRTYRLGGAAKSTVQNNDVPRTKTSTEHGAQSPGVTADFDQSDIDRYFRSLDFQDSLPSVSSEEFNQSVLRRRPSRRWHD